MLYRSPRTDRCQHAPLFALFATLVAALLIPGVALAQHAGSRSLFSVAPSGDLAAPGPGARGNLFTPGDVLASPRGPLIMPPASAIPMVPAGKVALALNARYGKNAPPIAGGLIWRIYSAKPGRDGNFRLIKEDKAPSPTLVLPPGAYIVHVDFGLATAVRPVTLRGPTVHETFDLPAGALRLQGQVGDVKIPSSQISFEVFKGSQFDATKTRPIAEHVLTGQLIVVPEGIYHIASHYGDANAVVRSDIRVQAGKLTDITINHRAAAITLKLVTQKGGEALANTAWSVLTPGGDTIKESIGAFPRVILAAGEYRAIARNEGKIYQRDFNVVAGVDGDVEVLAR